MRKVLSALATLAIVLAPGRTVAQDNDDPVVTYGTSGSWTINVGESNCYMLGSYDNDNRLFMSFDHRLDNVTLLFSDTATKALKNGDKRKISVVFVNPGYDDGWGEEEFSVSILDGKTYFAAGFDADDMLKDLAKYETLAFLYKEKIIRSLALTGSASAIIKLRECAKKQAKVNPSDLFDE